jgi:predicted ATPase
VSVGSITLNSTPVDDAMAWIAANWPIPGAFKHALVQDAAYGTLLRSRRQQRHARITATLEGQFPEIVETQPEVLAHHCTQAGLAERAITYLLKAGRQAMTRSAMTEAVVQLMRALRLVTDLPPGADRDQFEIDVQVTLGGAFAATKGFSAPEVERSYQRARELCRDRPDHFDLPAVLFGLHLYHQHRSGTHVAYGFAEELLRLAEQRQDKAACALGHWRLALNAMWSGNQQFALTHFEQAIAFYDRAEPHPSVVLSLSDVRVTSLNFIPLILLWRGDLDQAVTRSCTAFTAAHELGHAFTLCHVSHLNCWLHYVLGDPTLVKERAAKALKLSAEHGFSGWQRLAEFWDGWALATSGEVTAGFAQMRGAVSAIQAMGYYLQTPHRLGLMAELYTRSGSPTEALAVLTEALTIVDRTQERWFEAELHRLRAEALLAASINAAAAEASLRRAVAVAQQQDVKFWELRAALDLARLWRDHGRRNEARDLLAPVYGWFTEGFDTPVLRDAKALLDQLA